MATDSIQDSTRYVVSDVHRGSILPGERKEMNRDVFLLPGADVRGGIWSNDLFVSGPDVQVDASVYAQGSVSIDPEDEASEAPSPSPIVFGGSITATESLLVDTRDVKTRILSDVYTKRANINRAFIFGNVYADGAVVRNSVVLGGIFCKGSLDVSNSFIHTFQAHEAVLGTDVSIFAPFALAEAGITLNAPVRSLTFADVFENSTNDAGEGGEIVHLDEKDVFQVEGMTQPTSGDGASSTQTVLSMTERILDSALVQNRLQRNKQLLKRLSLSRHVESDESVINDLEETLWTAVRTPPSEDTSSRPSRSLEDLLNRFGLDDLGG